MAGILLVAFAGAAGRLELDPGWRTQVPGFDPEELSAFLFAQPSSLGGSGLGVAAHAKSGGELAVAHSYGPGWLGAMGGGFVRVALRAGGLLPGPEQYFLHKTMDLREGVPRVEAFGVVSKQNSWYLVGRGKIGLRTYRISRMTNPVVLDGRFERPSDFDLKHHWNASTAEFRGRQQGVRAVLALAPETASEVRKLADA